MKNNTLIAISIIAVIIIGLAVFVQNAETSEANNRIVEQVERSPQIEDATVIGYGFHPNQTVACNRAKSDAESVCAFLGGDYCIHGTCTYTLIQNPGELAYWQAKVVSLCVGGSGS